MTKYSPAHKEAIYEAFDRPKNIRVTAREVGVPSGKSHQWATKKGLKAPRLDASKREKYVQRRAKGKTWR